MAELDTETQQKIQELQGFEQTMNQLLMQKQAFQMELTETENAHAEVSQTKDDVFKLVGNIMVKTDKKATIDDLKKKQELLSLRLKSIDTQEADLTKRVEEIRTDVMKKIK
jgi:prefoldin beta subunit